MTLVAAIKVHDVPVLFGDLMLTGKDDTSTRRKILRLRPNLAIGWADTHIVARAALKDLDQALNRHPTIQDVREVLQLFSTENGCVAVQLTGWVLGESPAAFMWDGNYPDQFVIDEQFLIGTGNEVLWRFLNDRPLHSPPPKGVSAQEHASLQTLTLTGNLMKSDLSDRIQQSKYGFGVGYDILIAESGRFRYLSPIVYAAITAQVDGDGRVGEFSRPWGTALLRNLGEHTLCQLGLNLEGVMDVHLVSPVLAKISRASEARLERALLSGPFVFEGLYCVLFTQLMEGRHPWPPLVGIVKRNNPIWAGSDKRGVSIAAGGAIQSAANVMAQRRRGRW